MRIILLIATLTLAQAQPGNGQAASFTCWIRGPADKLAERPSPLDSSAVQLGGGTIKLCYGRPSARGDAHAQVRAGHGQRDGAGVRVGEDTRTDSDPPDGRLTRVVTRSTLHDRMRTTPMCRHTCCCSRLPTHRVGRTPRRTQ